MNTLKYISAVTALLSLAACQNEEMQLNTFLTDPNAVRITASVGEIGTRSNPLGQTTFFNSGDKVSIKTEDQDAVIYTFDGTNTWTPEGNQYLLWKKAKHTFTANYPSTYTGGAVIVETDQSDYANMQASDFMTFSEEIEQPADGGAISLGMKRQTARIAISKTYNWGNQYQDGDYKVNGIQIHNSQSVAITPYADDAEYFYALVAPTTGDAESTFITIDLGKGSDATSIESLTIKGIPAFKAGNSYTYKLSLGKNKAAIGDVEVKDWNTGSILDSDKEGKAEEVVDIPKEGYRYSEATNTYIVYTTEGLLAVDEILTTDVTDDKMESNIMLAADITLPAVEEGQDNWKSLGREIYYRGTFDGNGKSITGLSVSQNSFIYTIGSGGVVKNLTLVGCKINNYAGPIGAIACQNFGGRIECCTVASKEGMDVLIENTNKEDFVGGIVGRNANDGSTPAIISGCVVTNADGGSVFIKGSRNYIGGIAGVSGDGRASYYTEVAISDCHVRASGSGSLNIIATGLDTDYYGNYVGGIVGQNSLLLSGCSVTNTGSAFIIDGGRKTGGIIGNASSTDYTAPVSNCSVIGVSVFGRNEVGGLIGTSYTDLLGTNVVKNCTIAGSTGQDVNATIGLDSGTIETPVVDEGNTVNRPDSESTQE